MIVRTYRCNDCTEVFEVTLENSAQPDPDCPFCKVELQWQPRSFAIATNKSKAVDLAQKSIEADFGLTNFNDATREGETVAMGVKPRTTSETDTVMQAASEIQQQRQDVKQEIEATHHVRKDLKAQIDGFWSGTRAGPPPATAASFIAGAKAGPEADIGNRTMAALHNRSRELGISRVPRVLKPG